MADRDPATGHFLPGNRNWEARASYGPKPKFETAEALWDAACEYFAWCDEEPLFEAKAFVYEGSVKVENLLTEVVANGLTLDALRELAPKAAPGKAAALNAAPGGAADDWADYDLNAHLKEAK